MRRLGIAFAFALLVVVAELAHDRVRLHRASFPDDRDVLYLPPPEQLEIMSLGYREALADLVWIRAVIFAGDEIGGRNFAWIHHYLDAILRLAPTFRRPYAWGGVTAIYSGARIDRVAVDNAISVYRRGLERFPEDHELLFSLGMILLRVVPSLPAEYEAAERAQAALEGRELIRRSAAYGAPPLVRQLAATFVDDSASDQLAIQFLESQLLIAEDEGHKRLLRRKLEQLVGETGLESIEKLKHDFGAERRATYPYVPHDLYAVIRDDTRVHELP